MNISVLIIAHNEERYIRKCIESILKQKDKRADEIVLLLHNSTDRTAEIAKKYEHLIKIVRFNGEPGIVQARMEGLRHVTGDIILCIDGDSYAESNWVEEMSAAAIDENILVGSRVIFRGTFLGRLLNVINSYPFHFKRKDPEWIWGQSFALEAKNKQLVIDAYKKSIELTRQAGLSRNPDDYWLVLLLGKKELPEAIATTSVTCYTKERNSWQMLKRYLENIRNARKMRKFLKEH